MVDHLVEVDNNPNDYGGYEDALAPAVHAFVDDDALAGAEQVAADIEAAGIQVMLEKVGFETYRERIAAGEYDLYIGETQVSANLDLSALLSPNAVFGPGCAQDAQLLEAYRQMKAGEISLDDFDAAFQASMPVIPLLYRRGAVCFSRDFSANILATERDIFYNIEEW